MIYDGDGPIIGGDQSKLGKLKKRFNLARGLSVFFSALVILPLLWWFQTGELNLSDNAIVVAVCLSATAGLIGLFSERIPF
ncbi:hypothetical protein K3148_11775 [Qipengyuania aurantiaca]|uniref:Uncharacterized protein n=1 Tax=Qipengyuania aurantiaca TaxID=2867233 RepID=A0ABX8ZMW2_9SPHN|nr:hypothetical protein [Qipengyuania aurantiaca]QZD89479.1 hypothetical protein K3148_11775 [Qipengyuania aurantiaca]